MVGLEGGQEIGRLREEHTPARPELASFWSIIVMRPARQRLRTDGRAATLEEAKAKFVASGKAFRRADSESR